MSKEQRYFLKWGQLPPRGRYLFFTKGKLTCHKYHQINVIFWYLVYSKSSATNITTYSIIFASSPPKETDPHHPSLPLSATPSALATTNRSSGSINLPISYISYTWNHETYNTCDWLLSHSTMFSRFIRVIERNHCFILLYGSTLPHCMAITLCLSNNQWTYVLFPLFSN